MAGWRDNVRTVIPYVPGEQPREKNIIKLNTNENPYPPSKAVQEVLQKFDTGELRKYPDPTAEDLVSAISETYHVAKEQVFVGVGSDDVLAMSFLTFFNGKKPILFPDITYSFYDVWADLFRIPYHTPALDDAFHVKKEDYLKENGGIVLPNPNAPTGIAEPRAFYEDIVKKNADSVVIIDEAYVDFGADSALALIDTYENLLVVQTFSKSRSMAGSRIGFAIGSRALIQALNDVKYSFNSYTMDRLTIQLGKAALSDTAYFKECVKKICATREWTKEKLKEIGFTFGDSQANFIFARHETIKARELFTMLKEKHIFVRYFDKPRIDDYLRITIGTQEEMEQLLKTLKAYVEEHK